jgi:uncharacterized membrane protein
MSETPPPPGPPPAAPPPNHPPAGGDGFDVGRSFAWAWAKFQQNAATLIVSVLITAVLAAIPYFAVYVPLIAGGDDITIDSQTGDISTGGPGFLATLFFLGIAAILASLVYQVLGSNLIRMCLSIADGNKPAIGELFSFPRLVPVVITAVILAVAVGVGIMLCYLPGIVIGFVTAFTFHTFHDQDLEPVEAIKASVKLFTDNLGPAIVIVLLGGLVSGVGAIACGIGVLVTAPIGLLFIAHGYRSISGGTTVPA